jgi:hypothetical protein
MAADWHYSQNGQRVGPVSEEALRHAAASGTLLPTDLVWKQGMADWAQAGRLKGLVFASPPPLPVQPPPLPNGRPPTLVIGTPPANLTISDEQTIRRIADYERISGVLWLIIGIIQIATIIGAIAGIWNVIAATTRFRRSKQVRARYPGIPKSFEPIVGLVIVGVVNLLFGGVIGVIFVGFDFYIREKVLSNAHLFQKQTQLAIA